MRQLSAEAIYTRFLRENCNVPGVVDVTFHSLAVRRVCVVRLSKTGRADPWQAMFHVLGLNPSTGAGREILCGRSEGREEQKEANTAGLTT
jgi:hypothetical protein